MKKLLLLSLLVFTLILTGCEFKFNLFGNDHDDNDDNPWADILEQLQEYEYENENEDNNERYPYDYTKTSSIEGTYLIAEDESLMASSNYSSEISDSYFEFRLDNSFIAYLGFSNMLHGNYTMKDGVITCKVHTYSNEYSDPQDVSFIFTIDMISDALLKIKSAPNSFQVKTTYMNDAGEWVFDGGTKDMPLTSLTKDTLYTLWEPVEYNY